MSLPELRLALYPVNCPYDVHVDELIAGSLLLPLANPERGGDIMLRLVPISFKPV